LVTPYNKEINQKVVLPVAAKKKKRGRPFTGVDNRDPVMTIRLSLEMRAEIEEWASRQPDHPDRSEAIRRMITTFLRKQSR
jgi:hypothetical protein